jgi:winged helix DNA-binding protein
LGPVTLASFASSQALAWRLSRQLLDPVGTEPVEEVVHRLGAIQAQQGWAAELSIRTRRQRSEAGEVARARADGRLIMTFAFRGATHLMTPEDGGVYLALRAASRQWELKSWREYYGLAPSDWPSLLETVREALASGPLTVKELVAGIAARPKFAHLGPILADNPWSVMKALCWHGVMSFGPPRGRQTFERLDRNPHWAGIPDLDEAGMRAVEAYFRAYGPATPAHLHYWLGQGLSAGRKRLDGWIARFGDRLATVDVGGEPALILREDLDDLRAAVPSTVVRLLPAYDQWALGPGTADERIVPPARRAIVTRGANVVVVGGVVAGTWAIRDDEVAIDWFAESGRQPGDAIEREVERLAGILDRPLRVAVRAA